jgi:hypothetical protein
MTVVAFAIALLAGLALIDRVRMLHRLGLGRADVDDLVELTGVADPGALLALPGVYRDARGALRINPAYVPALERLTGNRGAFACSRDVLAFLFALAVALGQPLALPSVWLALAVLAQAASWLRLDTANGLRLGLRA